MRLLVTGSRTWDDTDYIWRILDGYLYADRGIALHHGACPRGADAIADRWATLRGREGHSILMRRHPARWRTDTGAYDHGAGMARNAAMVEAFRPWGGLCLAFIRDNSAGATGCARLAEQAGIEVVRHVWEDITGTGSRQLDLFDVLAGAR